MSDPLGRGAKPWFGPAVSALGLSLLVACAPGAPSPFAVAESLSSDVAGLPVIAVRRGDGAPFLREDWALAEAAARDHCAASGAVYARLPPSRDHTEIRLEGGVFSFVARCLPR